MPPPLYCNVTLVDGRGRTMDLAVFERVAATLFPLVYEVELAGAGEPLLHPRLEEVLALLSRYACNWRVTTHGTLFTERLVRLLARQFGCVTLALDAGGTDFDAVRQLAQWQQAEPQVRRFLAERYPHRLRVTLRPVLTRRTVREALYIVQWAREQRVEAVDFRSHARLPGDREDAPDAEEFQRVREALVEALAREALLEVRLDGTLLNPRPVPDRRTEFASDWKRALALRSPPRHVAVGIDGGAATSVEGFAAAWFR